MMTADAEKYATFWREFGRAVKEGLLDDFENREAILEISLVRRPRTTPEKPTTLRDYVARMKEGQEHIYYMTGESRSAIENSPHMEAFRAKGYEVLVLTDPIDEMWVDAVPGFDGKQFQSDRQGPGRPGVGRGQEGHRGRARAAEKDFDGLLTWMARRRWPTTSRRSGCPRG